MQFQFNTHIIVIKTDQTAYLGFCCGWHCLGCRVTACRLPAWRCPAQLSVLCIYWPGWCHSFIHRQQRIHIGQCTLYTKVRSHTQCIFVSRLDDTAAAPTAAIPQTGTMRRRRRWPHRWMGCRRNKNAAPRLPPPTYRKCIALQSFWLLLFFLVVWPAEFTSGGGCGFNASMIRRCDNFMLSVASNATENCQ